VGELVSAPSGLLQASIAGAGLVLATYALVVQHAKRIFEERSKGLEKTLQDLKSVSESILGTGKDSEGESRREIKPGDIKRLLVVRSKFKKQATFPDYLSPGMGVSFAVYLMSALACLLLPDNPEISQCLLIFATLTFLGIGVCIIIEFHKVLRREFEDCTRLQERAISEQKIIEDKGKTIGGKTIGDILREMDQENEDAKAVALQHLRGKYNVSGYHFIHVYRPLVSDWKEINIEGMFWAQDGQQRWFKLTIVDNVVTKSVIA